MCLRPKLNLSIHFSADIHTHITPLKNPSIVVQTGIATLPVTIVIPYSLPFLK